MQTPGDELVAEHVFRFGARDFDLYRNVSSFPRVSLVHTAHRATSVESAVELLIPLYDGRFKSEVVIEGDPGIAFEPVSDRERLEERITVTKFTATQIVVEVHCSAPGLLLYSENYYPGWVARVDGADAPVLPANVFMRGVPVVAGDHRVEMDYRPSPFRNGCLLMAASLVVLNSVWARSLFQIMRKQCLR
jgi:hypothetical protein